MGFSDRAGTGDCDPIDARYGRCIEIVDLRPIQPTWVHRSIKRAVHSGKGPIASVLSELLFGVVRRRLSWMEMGRRKEDFARLKTHSALAQQWGRLVIDGKKMMSCFPVKDDGFKVSPHHQSTGILKTISEQNLFCIPERSIWLDPHQVFRPVLPVLPTGDPLLAELNVPDLFFAM